MAISSAQQSTLFKVFTGMFGAAPGGYFGELAGYIAGGMLPRDLAGLLAQSNLFKSLYPSVSGAATDFADAFLTNLLGSSFKSSNATQFDTDRASLAAQVETNGAGKAVFDYMVMLDGKSSTDATYGTARTEWSTKVANATAYTLSSNGVSTDINILKAAALSSSAVANSNLELTTKVETLAGTSGNDTFTAYISDNSNTLNSGDKIFGGTGTDTLKADIGNAQAFAITPHTSSVENFIVRAEADNVKDSNDNNMLNNVQIDAERMVGTNWYETNSSRADLVIEDVRIEDTQITKDITIAMVSTDPGDVDFGVYFDQLSLRPETAATSGATLKLQIIDLENAKLQNSTTGNLVNDPAWGFYFTYGGTKYEIAKTAAFRDATTYDALKTLIENDIKAKGLEGKITVSVAVNDFTRFDDTGVARNGSTITLTSTTSSTFADTTLSANAGWLYEGAAPSNANTSYKMTTGSGTTSPNLITSEIVLDNVGRGSMGGDLLIGGLSTGDTSTSKGVEQFNIYVDRNSKLQTINSTNNTLEEVYIENKDHTEDSDSTATGYLTVTGQSIDLDNNSTGANQVDGTNDTSDNTGDDLAGDDSYDNAYGLSNVRVVDASKMTGAVTLTAELDDSIVAKYLDRKDTDTDTSKDNDYVNDDEHPASNDSGHTYGQKGFVYTLGQGADSLTLDISGTNLEASGTTNREDFKLTINGGTGNDSITTNIINADSESSDSAHWYINSNVANNGTYTNENLYINGDAGDDTIWTKGAGNFNINGGADNDTIYTDNTGAQALVNQVIAAGNRLASAGYSKAVWVFNDSDVNNDTDLNINNIQSGTNAKYALYGNKLTVTYFGNNGNVASGHGYEVTVDLPTSGYQVTSLQVNQAIKNAINSDSVLNKLLEAVDGPANSLVVKSKVDGSHVANDLQISVGSVTSISTTDAAAFATANGLASTSTTTDIVNAINTNATAFNALDKSDFELATDGTVATLTGADSTAVSDNKVNGGTGNDLIVLGTDSTSSTAGSNVDTANDTIVYADSFGNDIIVNFEDSVDGRDYLDFSSLIGTFTAAKFGAANIQTNGSIVIAAESTANDTDAEVKALYSDDTNATSFSHTHLYFRVDSDNKATVFKVTDAAAASDATITNLGTIEMVGTSWLTEITAENFIPGNTSPGTGSTGTGGTGGTGGSTTATVAVSAAGNVTDGGSTVNTTYTIAAGTYTYTITGAGSGDTLDFPNTTDIQFSNTSTTDGKVSLTYTVASTGQAAEIVLTGLTATQDANIFGLTSLNTQTGITIA